VDLLFALLANAVGAIEPGKTDRSVIGRPLATSEDLLFRRSVIWITAPELPSRWTTSQADYRRPGDPSPSHICAEANPKNARVTRSAKSRGWAPKCLTDATAALNHPYICTSFNIGPGYLVME
jgi:hypothetical protein